VVITCVPIAKPATQRLRAMVCDHLSIMRGRYLPGTKSRSDDTRFATATFAVRYDKDLMLEVPGMMCLQGIPDMILRRCAPRVEAADKGRDW
jgi:hypothetical protein